MAGSDWGLLGPDRVPSNRRTRTLGLGRAVRRFNELAVPGLGGLWYGRQALYTVLAMAVAKRLRTWNIRQSHIQVANAIEAVACTIGYRHNGWSPDWRMRGRNKLSRDTTAPSFKHACRSSYYVSQPMRMSTAQALPSLGLALAPSVRFNAFECGEEADVFLGSSIGHLLVGKNTLVDHLCYWVMGSPLNWKSYGVVAALNPLEGLDEDARHWLQQALLKGATLTEQQCQRRKAAWDWMACLHAEPGSVASLDDVQGPTQLDAAHWHDLRAGTKLIEVRNAAVAVLDSVEGELDTRQRRSLQVDGTLPLSVHQALRALTVHAQSFLALNHYDEDANRFCSECVGTEADVLRALLRRDDQVLCLVDDCARPGPAYSGRPPAVEKGEQGADEEVAETGRNGLPLPAGISYRVENMYLFYLDLAGELDVAITIRNAATEVTA